MKLYERNPQDLHPVRWLAWIQHAMAELGRHESDAKIAAKIGVSAEALCLAKRDDWPGDREDPWPEPQGRAKGRPPRIVKIVEGLARFLGHDCDLSRYRVYRELRYLLAYDETSVSYLEWGAWIAAHRQYLRMPVRKALHDTMSPRCLGRYVDEIGMNGDLAAEIYARQVENREKLYVTEDQSP